MKRVEYFKKILSVAVVMGCGAVDAKELSETENAWEAAFPKVQKPQSIKISTSPSAAGSMPALPPTSMPHPIISTGRSG